MDTFAEWLVKQLNERDMSQSDLARATGLTRQAISYYASGKSKDPDRDALKLIARALHLPPEAVFTAAGILPAKKDDGLTPRKRQLLHILDEIDDDTLTESIIAMLERQLEQKQKQTPGHGSLKVVR